MQNTDQTSREALTAALLLGEEGLQSDLIDQLMDEDLAYCMFTAATQGNVGVMTALWKQRGPFEVVYEHEPGAENERLNGKVFESKKENLLSSCTDHYDVKLLFQTILSYGIKGLLEPGLSYPYLFRHADISTIVDETLINRFCGELPVLDAGCLQWPELAMALEAEGQRSLMPEAFRPMLCWATEEMLRMHGARLTPLRTFQGVSYERNSVIGPSNEPVIFRVSMEEFAGDVQPAEDVVIHGITLGVEAHSGHTESVGILFQCMAPIDQQCGFADPQGRILCETRADFLLGFPVSPTSEANLAAADRYMDKRFPLAVLGNHVATVCLSDFQHSRDCFEFPGYFTRALSNTWNPSNRFFFFIFKQSEEVNKKLMRLMRKDQWLALLRSCETARLEADVLLALRDVHAIDNRHLRFSLLPQSVDRLHDAGYRFVDDTTIIKCPRALARFVQANPGVPYVFVDFEYRVVLMHKDNWKAEGVISESHRLHGLAQAMNLWTGAGDHPKGVRASLDDLISLDMYQNDSTELMGTWVHLVKMGVEACVDAASSLEHWKWIVKIFSIDQLRPYLKVMPRQARGLVLESGIGL
jgi:hypothetical protein